MRDMIWDQRFNGVRALRDGDKVLMRLGAGDSADARTFVMPVDEAKKLADDLAEASA